MIKATVAETGNSYTLQVPKSYIDDNGLKLGDTVVIKELVVRQQQALAALVRRSKTHGAVQAMAIRSPGSDQRASSDPWVEVRKD
jgi:antitoxin component of MazEF toxin-antitoxin module